MTSTHTFLGIPVEGDITRGRNRVEQRSIEELQPIMQAVLDDPLIAQFGWTQYTPYFNDGEPCEFTVYEPWFLTVEDTVVDDDYYYDGFTVGYGEHPTLGKRKYTYEGHWPNRTRIDGEYTGNHEASFDRARALNEALQGGAFENVLLDAFGDHAKITVTRNGIQIDFYEHD